MAASYKIDWSNNSSFEVSRGYSYTYKLLRGSSSTPTKPTIILLHGFPEQPEVFDDLAHHLHHGVGYDVLVPTLLGYAPTSQPDDPSEYALALQVKDIDDILEHEHITSIISMGRDWGSPLSSRFPMFLPAKTKACVIMCVQYMSTSIMPRQASDMPSVVSKLRARYKVDYDNYSYFQYFNTDECAPELDKSPLRAARIFARFSEMAWDWEKFRDIVRVEPVPTDEPQLPAEKAFVARWSKHSFKGPLNWYKALCRGFHRQHEEKLSNWETFKIEVPTLWIGGAHDDPCPASGRETQREHIPDLENVVLEKSGHFFHLDDPEGLKKAVTSWLQRTESKL